MPATVIAERIGWTRGITVLKERVAELRPAHLPPDPVSRTQYEIGDIAQCDLWFAPIQLPVGFAQTRRPAQLPVLTMVTGYCGRSRNSPGLGSSNSPGLGPWCAL
jgi:hypothetical protein